MIMLLGLAAKRDGQLIKLKIFKDGILLYYSFIIKYLFIFIVEEILIILYAHPKPIAAQDWLSKVKVNKFKSFWYLRKQKTVK